MEVILLERIEKLGGMGDIVQVKNGYARNYLLPQKKALRATEANKARYEREREALETLNDERRVNAENNAGNIDGKDFVLIRQASDTLQLYGSVTARDIADAITASGVAITRQQVRLDRPIKTLGLHDVRVSLHPEVFVTVKANVARSDEEADIQARGGTILPAGEEELPPEQPAVAKEELLEESALASELEAEAGAAAEPAEAASSEEATSEDTADVAEPAADADEASKES